MLTGYRNLTWLKARLLPADMGADTDFDADLTAIGLGVAAAFDAATGRKLRRDAAATFECPADRESVVLTSYPIESITSADLLFGGTTTDVSGSIMGLQNGSGIVDFGGQIGSHLDRLVIVSAGGYWCDDDDSQPAGSAALPDDLLNAWVMQCRATCEAENTFRTKAAGSPDKKTGAGITLQTLDLLPKVRATLQLHTRFP